MIRRVFVSDIHMSTGFSLFDPKSQYDWLDADEAMKFAGFLKYLETATDDHKVDEVFLVGDVFDTWVYPNNVKPPDYSAIVRARQIVIDNLKALVAAKDVHYICGNHDISITEQFVKTNLGNKIKFDGEYADIDGIHVEHGHRYAIFNAPDPDAAIPVGHYISRLGATVATKEPTFTQNECLKNALKPLSSGENIVNLVIDAVAARAAEVLALTPTDKFIDTDGNLLTIVEIKGLYAKLLANWETNCTTRPDNKLFTIVKKPLTSALVELGVGVTFENIAGNIINQSPEKGYKVIIFGHTHKAELTYLRPYGPPPELTPPPGDETFGIYANCGAWCDHNGVRWDKHTPYTYIVTETDNGEHTVSLKYWDFGMGEEPSLMI